MILSAPFVVRGLRWVPPAVVIIGNCTTYPTLWLALRLLTLPLPRWVFRGLEQRLYSHYQEMTGFFYETWSGVEVSLLEADVEKGALENHVIHMVYVVLGIVNLWSCVLRIPCCLSLQFRFYGDRPPSKQENVLYISNHQCTGVCVCVCVCAI